MEWYWIATIIVGFIGLLIGFYFLQKKGWLGVNAWPDTLTEKEYKKAFLIHPLKFL